MSVNRAIDLETSVVWIIDADRGGATGATTSYFEDKSVEYTQSPKKFCIALRCCSDVEEVDDLSCSLILISVKNVILNLCSFLSFCPPSIKNPGCATDLTHAPNINV